MVVDRQEWVPCVRLASGAVLRDTAYRPRDLRLATGGGRHSEGADRVEVHRLLLASLGTCLRLCHVRREGQGPSGFLAHQTFDVCRDR